MPRKKIICRARHARNTSRCSRARHRISCNRRFLGSFSPPRILALEIFIFWRVPPLSRSRTAPRPNPSGSISADQFRRIHTARCPSTGNRSILMQIPDAFANYLPDPSQLWFSIDYDSTNPESAENISQFRRLLLSMMQLHGKCPTAIC